jgi:hypothetical protein
VEYAEIVGNCSWFTEGVDGMGDNGTATI